MDRNTAIELTKKYSEFADWFTRVTEITIPMGEEGKQIRLGLIEMLTSADSCLRSRLKEQHPDVFAEREAYEKRVSGG